MFTLETQLHETVNGNIGASQVFCQSMFFPQQCLTGGLFTLWHVSKNVFIFQNILKRTTPGSRDEDTAMKAFNELKKVVIIIPNSHLDEHQYYRW